MYVTLIGDVEVFVKASFTLPVPEFIAGVILATAALVHVKLAPGVVLVAAYENVEPEHIEGGVKLLLNKGIGGTKIVVVMDGPLQKDGEGPDGVIVNVTV